MSNLIEMIFAMQDKNEFDCIILQKMIEGSNNAPDPSMSSAIIRKIPTPSGMQWAVHSLHRHPSSMVITGSGMYGTIDQVVTFAEKWYPSGGVLTQWVGTSYSDPEFPPNLIPM